MWILWQAVGYVRKRSFAGSFINDAVWEFFPGLLETDAEQQFLVCISLSSLWSAGYICSLVDRGFEQELGNSVPSSYMLFLLAECRMRTTTPAPGGVRCWCKRQSDERPKGFSRLGVLTEFGQDSGSQPTSHLHSLIWSRPVAYSEKY